MNTHYLADYQEKFLHYYRAERQKLRGHGEVIENLEKPEGGQVIHTNGGRTSSSYSTILSTTLGNIALLGIHGIKAEHLTKLLPSDEMDDALEIMSQVRAYYQG